MADRPPRRLRWWAAGWRAGWQAWWRARTLRARVTLLATLLLAVALIAGAVLLQQAVRAALLSALDASATRGAEDVAVLVSDDRLPEVIPVVGEGAAVAQVLDGSGRVVAASPTASRTVPLLSPDEVRAARDGRPRFVEGERIADPLPLRVVVRLVGPDRVVVAGVSAGTYTESLDTVRVALLLGVPALLLVLAATTWTVVGSALRPVESLRRGAALVSAGQAGRRLPVPAGRDEVHRLAVTLNEMLDRLQAASDQQRRFVADAAHELRTPLAGVRAHLEVSLAHPEAEPWPHTAQTVLDEVLRLSGLVDDLLVLARLEAAPTGVQREPVALTDVVCATVEQLPTSGVPVRLGEVQSVVVAGDREALRRVVDNLVANARRHAATAVEVSVRQIPGAAELVVDDDGPGIPEQQREVVFERFRRLDTARSRGTGGTGLGLAIVRQLVSAQDGVVRVGDSPTGGARLVVTLPVGSSAPATPLM